MSEKFTSGRQTHRGFTLVELAIVITIIGLIIGGVLKGQDMIRNAKVTATIRQFGAIDAAIATFRDMYDHIPGDMPDPLPQRRIPGCTGTCIGGDGNSTIGLTNVTITASMTHQTGVAVPQIETTMFWRHLHHADLLTGTTGADPATPAWGETHPYSPLEGGIHLAYIAEDQTGLFPSITSSHYLGLRLEILAQPPAGSGAGTTTPVIASRIDRKTDDSNPNAGYFLYGGALGSSCDTSALGVTFDQTSTIQDCLLFSRTGMK